MVACSDDGRGARRDGQRKGGKVEEVAQQALDHVLAGRRGGGGGSRPELSWGR
jgi:hypothetical protein